MAVYIYPYKAGSSSVKNLKEGLGVKSIKFENSKFKPSGDKTIINWGSSNMNKELLNCVVLNKPEAVSIAANKQLFFERVAGIVDVPESTTDMNVAKDWFMGGRAVVVRETLNGYGGDGLVLLETYGDWERYNHNRAKLYVKYIPKKDEYRVHVMGGQIIDIQRKAAKVGQTPYSWKVRNHANGFVFVREGVEPPEEVLKSAILAVEACGLDFGAVDVIWNSHYKKAYVLEVNTAPGLEGSTVKSYVEGLDRIFLGEKSPKKKKNYPPFDLGAYLDAQPEPVMDIILDELEDEDPEEIFEGYDDEDIIEDED